MQGLPLHPMLVHIPLALAIFLPPIVAGIHLSIARERLSHHAWLIVVALSALLFTSGLVTYQSGGAEEEKVERVVAKQWIEEHEERAETFVWASALTLVLALAASFVKTQATASKLRLLVLGLSLLVAGLGTWAGHAGGELVYIHGAASAYATPTGPAPDANTPDRD